MELVKMNWKAVAVLDMFAEANRSFPPGNSE